MRPGAAGRPDGAGALAHLTGDRLSNLELFEGAPRAKPVKPARVWTPSGRDPFLIQQGQRTAISLSGGRTSAYLLWRVLKANGWGWGVPVPEWVQVQFANTCLEHWATLQFVRDIGEFWQVPIAWVEFRDDDAGWAAVDFDTASREGEPYVALVRKRGFLPNPVTRFCTAELKIRAMHRRLRDTQGWMDEDEGWDQLIGIRADEPGRVARIRARGTSTETVLETMAMPLAEAGITKGDVGAFWKQQPFDLALPNNNGVTMLGNCVLCFLKPGAQVLSIIEHDPDTAKPMMFMERIPQSTGLASGDGALFRNDRPSYAQMHAFALAQGDLFRTGTAATITAELIERLRSDTEPGADCMCGPGDGW